MIREIKKTSYRPKAVILGSREQQCIQAEIRKQPASVQKALCRSLGYNCPYRRSLDIKSSIDIFYNKSIPNNGLMDIEDLYSYGQKHSVRKSSWCQLGVPLLHGA